jgi:hypothetical protein
MERSFMEIHENQPNTADNFNILRQGFKEQDKSKFTHSGVYKMKSCNSLKSHNSILGKKSDYSHFTYTFIK